MKKLWGIFVLFALVTGLFGQTTLAPGDIAFTGANFDDPDQFSIVFLVDISTNTVIKFTDNGWFSSGSWRTGEGVWSWTSGQDYSAGTEIIISLEDCERSGSLAFSGSGDQIIAYQNDSDMISAINSEGAAVWQSDATSSNTSAIPTGLTNGLDCIAITEIDNFIYNRSIVTGTRSELLSAINNATNWTGDNSTRQTLSTSGFTISGSTPSNQAPTITNTTHTPSTITSLTTVSVSANVSDSDGTVSSVVCNWGTASGSLTNSINMSASSTLYTTDTDIPVQTNGTTVYYEIVATDDDATSATDGEYNYTVHDPSTTTLPYSETFDSDLGDCYTYSVSGATKEWFHSTDVACANGYGSTETEEDWLIFSGINLDNYSNEVLSFDTEYLYGADDADNYLKLMYSSNYTGTGDPSSATWTELSYSQPSAAETMTSSGNVNLNGISGTLVYIAFKYHGTNGNYRRWYVDNISIEETIPGTPEITNITRTPAGVVTTSDAVSVSADVTDSDATMTGVKLYWGTTTGVLGNEITMSASGDTYTTSSDIPAQSDGTTIFYIITVADGEYSTSSSEQNYTVSDPTVTVLPYDQTFDTDMGDMTTYSVTGDQVWEWVDYGNPAGCAKMSGYYNSVTYENEDWMITPAIDMDASSGEMMTFETARNYYPIPLQLLYSTNYIEGENPNNYTWTDISDRAIFAENDDWNWVHSGYIDLSDISGGVVYFAFKYTCTTTYEGTWEFDNLHIYENNSIIIYNESRTPSNIVQPDAPVTVTADIIYGVSDFTANLVWGNSSGDHSQSVEMTNTSGNTFTGTIPGYTIGTNIFYQIEVNANDGKTNSTTEQSYTVETYYSRAEGKKGSELKAALHDIIKGHKEYPYTGTPIDVWDILMDSNEDPNNSDNVILLYTGRSQAKTFNASTSSDPDAWNREHVWAKSHGGFDVNPPAGTDCHHLMAADASVNSTRSNKDFDNGGTADDEATECYTDTDSWEPRDAVKGDIARMMFYMTVRYEGEEGYDLELVDYTGTSGPEFGKLSTLLEWHMMDPVDDFERHKNEVVYSYQGNRNPFVDHPEYVSLIWTSTPSLMISEVADPADDSDAKYVEIYNNCDATIDFSQQEWYVSRQSNGGSTWGDIQLTGTIEPGDIYTIAIDETEFTTVYGFAPDLSSGVISGNGNDGYFLYFYGDHNGGTLIDAYGVVDQDGSGQSWEYTDGHAYRNAGVSAPTATWAASEWTIEDANVADLRPNDTSLPVELTEFTGAFDQGKIILKWKTESEVNNLGFNVYRSDESDDNFAKINETLIEGNGNTTNASTYEFEDTEVIGGHTYFYKIEDVSSNGKTKMHTTVSVKAELDPNQLITSYELGKAYPNPFNPETTISYTVPSDCYITIRIYNIQGQLIKTLVNEAMTTGKYKVVWNGLDNRNMMASNGVYFYNMITNSGFSKTEKVIFLK